jgi:hypothetical protein
MSKISYNISTVGFGGLFYEYTQSSEYIQHFYVVVEIIC